MSGLQMEPVISKGLGPEFVHTKARIQWHISLGQDTTAFQAEVAAIQDCATNCLRKRQVKEQTTICTDSKQVAVADLGASGVKLLFVVDCIKKLTAMSEVNQVTIIWVPGRDQLIGLFSA